MAVFRWGAEQRVNTTTAGSQYRPAIASLSGGGFVVVWVDASAGADVQIRFQIYNAAGARVGAEQFLNAGANVQDDPAVTGLSDGGFAISFTNVLSGSDSDPVIYRYNAGGGLAAIVGVDGTVDLAGQTSITALGSGYAIVYRAGANSGDATLRLFDSNNNPTSGLIAVQAPSLADSRPDIAVLRGGSIVVAYVSDGGTRFRLFSSAGTPLGEPVQVFSLHAGNSFPAVTALTGGGFVVVWQAAQTLAGAGPETTGSPAVWGAVYNAAGLAIRSEFLVNSRTNGFQGVPEITATLDGGFVAVWESDDPGSQNIAVQAFNALGERVGGEAVVNVTTLGAQAEPVITVLADGRVVVVWTDNSFSADDPSGTSVRIQILDPRDGVVIGSDSSETLYGGEFADQIDGQAGNDVLFGLGGDDLVYAGAGADQAFGLIGSDILYGGFEGDTLNGGTGDDSIMGEDGSDTLIGELGDDLLVGGDGADTLNGSAGQDAIYGGFGNDVMLGENGDDAFFGDVGDDTGFGGAGADVMNGEAGGDTLLGEAGDDLIDGGAGGDFLNGGAGVDNLIGGADGDILVGGGDGDRLEAGVGADVVWWQSTSEGNDLVVGYSITDDQLRFTGAAFGFAPGATLTNGTTFVAGAGPTQAVATFYYTGGSLFFDPDGTGSAPAVFLALFQGSPALSAGEFTFV